MGFSSYRKVIHKHLLHMGFACYIGIRCYSYKGLRKGYHRGFACIGLSYMGYMQGSRGHEGP